MTDKTIKVIYKPAFGQERFYPSQKGDLASALLRAMGRKSFTHEKLSELKEAGFKIEATQETPKF